MTKKYIAITLFFFTTFLSLYSQADSSLWEYLSGHRGGVAKVENKLYLEECGSCHFAYQPGLLPARSWKKMMQPKQMQDHFGDNIELDSETTATLTKYMVNNAADTSKHKRSRKIMKRLSRNQTPLRITETPYIKRKHYEIPARFITQEEVGSLAHCQTCHTKADAGDYDDDAVNIPNVGHWDDD